MASVSSGRARRTTRSVPVTAIVRDATGRSSCGAPSPMPSAPPAVPPGVVRPAAMVGCQHGAVQPAALARQAVKVAAATVDRWRPAPAGIVVLIYHRVGRARASRSTSRCRCSTSSSPTSASGGRCCPSTRPWSPSPVRHRSDPPPVVVTFDDGTADFVDHALPVLGAPPGAGHAVRRHGLRRRGADVPRTTAVRRRGRRSATRCATGLVTVGSPHPRPHPARPPPGRRGRRRARPVDRPASATELGVRPAHFAYPKAVPPARRPPPGRSRPASARPRSPAPGPTPSAPPTRTGLARPRSR